MYTSRVSCRRRWRTHNSQFSVARMPCSAMKAIAAAEDTQSYIIGYNISRQHIRNACVSWLPVVKTEYRLDVVCRYFLRMFYERFVNTKLHCCVFYDRTNHIRVKIKLSPNSTRNSFIYVTNNVAGHIVRKHQKVMSILYILPLSCDRGGGHTLKILKHALISRSGMGWSWIDGRSGIIRPRCELSLAWLVLLYVNSIHV